MLKDNNKETRRMSIEIILVFLLLNLNTFHFLRFLLLTLSMYFSRGKNCHNYWKFNEYRITLTEDTPNDKNTFGCR